MTKKLTVMLAGRHSVIKKKNQIVKYSIHTYIM